MTTECMCNEYREENEGLRDRIVALETALKEIARVKRGGIEFSDSDEDWIRFWTDRCSKYEAIARKALNP